MDTRHKFLAKISLVVCFQNLFSVCCLHEVCVRKLKFTKKLATLCWAVKIFVIFPCKLRLSVFISPKKSARYASFEINTLSVILAWKSFSFTLPDFFLSRNKAISSQSLSTRCNTLPCDNQHTSVWNNKMSNFPPSSIHKSLKTLVFLVLLRI